MKKLSDYAEKFGEKSLSAAVDVIRYIYPESWGADQEHQELISTLDARLAPSLITRCESEYLNISSPRFAVRVQIPGKGFVNLRRIADLESSIRQRFRLRDLSSLLRNPIAETLLSAPDRLKNHVCLNVDLASEFAEELPQKYGVPYVSQLDWLGGGVCAECVAMMAVTLLYKYAKGVHGVAEVNSISLASHIDLLNPNGMSAESLVEYFKADKISGPGLNASIQIPHSTSRSMASPSRALGWGLRAYVASGFPVVFPNNLTVLREQVIRKNCELDSVVDDGWGDDFLKVRPHVVLIVGANSDVPKEDSFPEPTLQSFIVHDPATLPFLKASAQELFDSVSSKSQGADAGEEDTLCAAHHIIPVTPKEVTVPLLPQKASLLHLDYCLYEIACWIQSPPGPPALRFRGRRSYLDGDRYGVGVFRLIDAAEWSRYGKVPVYWDRLPSGELANSGDFPTEISNQVAHAILELKKKGIHSEFSNMSFWVWVQFQIADDGKRQLTFWRADRTGRSNLAEMMLAQMTTSEALGYPEVDFDTAVLLSECWLGTFQELASESWEWIHPKPQNPRLGDDQPEESSESPSKIKLPENVTKALINSFDPERRFDVSGIPYWPPAVNGQSIACEFYCFMEPWLEKWVREGRLTTGHAAINQKVPTAVELLSEVSRNPQLRDQAAELIYDSYSPRKIPIVALASFFQEHAAPSDEARSRRGVRALQGLMELGIRLTEVQKKKNLGGHADLSVIELVCGSRIDRISRMMPLVAPFRRLSPRSMGRNYDLVASLQSTEVSIDHLIRNLSRSLQNNNLSNRMQEAGLRIALELEPGSLFTNSSLESLASLTQRIDSSPLLNKVVFLNLDIAHFHQAGILPQDLLIPKNPFTPDIFSRLTHVHIAGHSPKAHFGDTEFKGELFGYEAVVQKIAENFQNLSRNLVISCEFEAAPDVGAVNRSAQSVLNL